MYRYVSLLKVFRVSILDFSMKSNKYIVLNKYLFSCMISVVQQLFVRR